MRLEQSCPCGSAIKVDWAPHAVNTRETERQAERNEARKLIDQWRTAHRPCLKRLEPPVSESGGHSLTDQRIDSEATDA
jgi:hypothetical protein